MATQSYANTSFGLNGLALMAQGLSAQEVLDQLIAEDESRARRQVGLMDLPHLFFKRPASGEMMAIEGDLAREVQHILQWAQYYD